eukprot:COSAG01_NODE_2397_length_7771_cov_12.578076_7_plen_371_part_00
MLTQELLSSSAAADQPDTPPVTLRLHGVGFSVLVKPADAVGARGCLRGRVEKKLLDGVSASFEPGQVTALMGPSGAGKTTLLNVLSGHAEDYGKVSGSVTANGADLPSGFRQLCCLVPQDDVLLPGLTVAQTLRFGAALRLNTPREQREAHVTATMEALGLLECKDVLVGSAEQNMRGISGGQRKRTSIALELLKNPSVMFLDEPTSGLDSKMAEDVASLLGQLARGAQADGSATRRTVICTIHQPSSRIFQGFDRCLLLAQGRVAYGGSVAGVVQRLESVGLPCPALENPADHTMRLLQEQGAVSTLCEAQAQMPVDHTMRLLQEQGAVSTLCETQAQMLDVRGWPPEQQAPPGGQQKGSLQGGGASQR